MPDEPLRQFVFLLKYYDSDLVDANKKIKTDKDHWTGSTNPDFMPVTGAYDMVVLAEGGTEYDALHYAVYLHRTERYRVMATLTVHSLDEFSNAIKKDEDPKRK